MSRWIVICVFLLPICVQAQLDTLPMLEAEGPEAVILNTLSDDQPLEVSDSDVNIAQLLSRRTGIQIQGQGGSYLRTALYRGQAARHMAIMWEGINIQNQFNGTYDLGLIPTTLFNNSEWYDGNFSAALGTAAMSGALVLDQSKNEPVASAGVAINDQSNVQYNLKFRRKIGKVKHAIGINLWDNANKFRYRDLNEILKRQNSGHLQSDITYNSRITWSNDVQSKVSYWYQNVERVLPSSTISSSIASQKDVNHRFSLSNIWEISEGTLLSTSLGYMNEYLGYFQSGINSESKSDVFNFNGKLNVDWGFSHILGVNVRYEDGELTDTINPLFTSFYPNRITSALFYNGKSVIEKSTFNFSLRQELVGSEFQFPVGQLSYKYDHHEDVNYKISIGSNFNYPGFNDLYWPMGGNPNLETEKSYQLELGVNFKSLDIKVYRINTKDKIIWAPNENNIWTPDNISSTTSTGIELEYSFNFTVDQLSFDLIPLLNYNHTINNDEGQNLGNQLLYNPKFNSRLNLNVNYREWELNLNHSYTSKRFQSLDNVSVLDPYQLIDIELLYQLNFNEKYISKMHFGVNNIFDQSYELVKFYPQSLRSIYFGARISIQ